jgi:hypothetical protein
MTILALAFLMLFSSPYNESALSPSPTASFLFTTLADQISHSLLLRLIASQLLGKLEHYCCLIETQVGGFAEDLNLSCFSDSIVMDLACTLVALTLLSCGCRQLTSSVGHHAPGGAPTTGVVNPIISDR